ncbi:metalloproteinase inhibitor 2-like [Mytilus californianus]|uniref:metalloproteinase inhibitor 2-like n=1 Tax=Mytilus californianus TaxID=6549 RepID=UPI0022482161|nr:metalloproteinase inhibitor 2-like [Mytilus californianus]
MGCMIGVVFVFVTLLSWFSPDVSACSCFPTHPQTIFCQNSFALVGVILKRTPTGQKNIKYTVRVVKRIKGNIGKVGSEFEFKTPSTGASCGVSYTIGTMQFLMGRSQSNGNTIKICNMFFPKTFENWVYLLTRGRNSYIQNCKCKVLEEGDASSPMSCRLSNNSKSCFLKTAICRRKQGGKCEWKNDEQCS